MIREFEIRDEYRKGCLMGYVTYNTENKVFRVFALKSFPKGSEPDYFLEKYSKESETGEFPDWESMHYIRRRLLPPNRHGIELTLKHFGLKEYDEMTFIDATKGRCAMDPYYFKEITGENGEGNKAIALLTRV